MPWFLELIITFFGKIALKFGLKYLEDKYPGAKPIIDLIIGWLGQQAADGNLQAADTLHEHVKTLCTSGVACEPTLKND